MEVESRPVLLRDEAFVLPPSNQPLAWATRDGIQGLGYNKFNWMWFENISMG